MKMLVSGALVLLVAFWTAYGAEAWTRRTLRGQLARYPVPMLLTGLPVDLGPVAPILRQDSDSFLLIIISDECAYCRRDVPRWIEQFSAPSFPRSLRVAVVSIQGHQLGQELDRARRSAGLSGTTLSLRSRDAKILAARSGVLSTPALVVLDRHFKCLLVLDDLENEGLFALQRIAPSQPQT